METHIKLADGTIAKLGCRHLIPSDCRHLEKSDSSRYIYIYYPSNKDPMKFCLASCQTNLHELDYHDFVQLSKDDNRIVVSQKFWKKAQWAHDIELFDHQNNEFVSRDTLFRHLSRDEFWRIMNQ